MQEAKDNTKRVLEVGELPSVPDKLDDGLDVLIAEAGTERYVAILAFVAPDPAFDEAIDELRAVIRDMTRATTTFGYGPRYLHSTGQFHKGGPPTGRFLQLIGDSGEDLAVPGEDYTFRTLKEAQAVGDLQTLASHELPTKRVRLEGDLAAGVREITKRVEGMR